MRTVHLKTRSVSKIGIGHFIRLVVLIAFVKGACSSESSKQHPLDDEEQLELPVDGHLSAELLPLELSNSCTCERSPACISYHNATACGARILYLVGIHNNRTVADAVYLFRGIRDSRNTILIHIDRKFDMKFYNNSLLRQEIEACPCGSHVEVASVHNASWGS